MRWQRLSIVIRLASAFFALGFLLPLWFIVSNMIDHVRIDPMLLLPVLSLAFGGVLFAFAAIAGRFPDPFYEERSRDKR